MPVHRQLEHDLSTRQGPSHCQAVLILRHWPACLVVPTEDQVLDDYTIIHGLSTEHRVWNGRGKLQEAELTRKHVEYLHEMLLKFNRLRQGDGT